MDLRGHFPKIPGSFLRKIFEYCLEHFQKVAVTFVDHPLLNVPDTVRQMFAGALKEGNERSVIFEYGLDMPISIPDLKVTDKGIEATLSIQRTPYLTFVPWEAVIDLAGVTVLTPLPSKMKSHLKLIP